MAATAPAFASTPQVTNALTFVAAGSGAVATPVSDLVFHDFEFSGASLLVGGTPTPGAVLTLTVTFSPKPAGSPGWSSEMFVFAAPAGWTSSQIDEAASTVTYTYGGAVTHGLPIVMEDGVFFGLNWDDVAGTFHLVFAIDGLTSASSSFDTPALMGARKSTRIDPSLVRSSRSEAPAEASGA